MAIWELGAMTTAAVKAACAAPRGLQGATVDSLLMECHSLGSEALHALTGLLRVRSLPL